MGAAHYSSGIFFGVLNMRQLQLDAHRFGWGASIFARVAGFLQKFLRIHICAIRLRPLALSSGQRNPPPEGYLLATLDRSGLMAASENPAMRISPGFIQSALDRGDTAFGALHEGQVIAYVWRTMTRAPHVDGLWVRVSKPFRYGYKAFTHPDHRGKHLNPAIALFTDAHGLAQGYTHDIGFVALHNLASLATGKYKGFATLGYAGYVNWFGRKFTFRTPRVKEAGFEFFEP